MFLKCLLFLLILAEIAAGFSDSFTCRTPRLQNGRIRTRARSKLVKFICFPGFILAGNKYATCRNGEWDEPIPVCVKPGCIVPPIQNGLPMISHGGAYVIFFCYPRHKLIGSSAMYCDGRRWNTTAPTCVDTSEGSHLTCNFEDPNLCGWTQDELHDFDWRRLNKKTPSSFLLTGPQHDHTFGENGNGYYMYIESTSRLENETARLVSPVYDGSLTNDGCFSFYYHMFGKTTGGLKVYQKPINNSLLSSFTLFEKWGNQGDIWYSGVVPLNQLDEDFQIIIEGIRGSGYTSDIAIDDVAILQGENCTVARAEATTPTMPPIAYSCVGRCNVGADRPSRTPSRSSEECGCSFETCIHDFDCCPDFFDVCISFPQTEKLIAETSTIYYSKDVTISTTASEIPTTPKIRLPPTRHINPTTTLETSTIIKTIPTTNPPPPPPPTNPPTPSATIKQTSKKSIIVPVPVNATAKPKESQKGNSTSSVLAKVTRSPKKPIYQTTGSRRIYFNDKLKAAKEQKIELSESKDKNGKSSGLKTSLLVIAGVMLMVGAVWLVMWSASSRGRNALAKLRGRVRHDPDVQYLHSADDHDE